MNRIIVADVRTVKPVDLPAYDAVATDPPWGQGMTTYFGNLAGVPGMRFGELVTALVRLVGPRGAWVLMGERWTEEVRNCFLRPSTVLSCEYTSGPCSLIAVAPATNAGSPGLNWKQAMSSGLATLPSEATVLDPFAGYGSIAKLCADNGLSYVGIELSAARARRSGLVAAK